MNNFILVRFIYQFVSLANLANHFENLGKM